MSLTQKPAPGPPDPATRFSNRVADYVRYRPSFPEALIGEMAAKILTPSSKVADIGSGSGIFSKQLAPYVGTLYCVEPNREMREHSVRFLSGCPNVRVVDGSAEATGLPDASVDVVTAAQAFHWFDRERAKREFRRILTPGGRAALLWYERSTTGNPFLEGYERLLLQYSIDYKQVDHRNLTPEVIAGFFHPAPVRRLEAMMTERMDLDAIRGRIGSSSYTPPAGHPNHAPLMAGIEELFNRCRSEGTVAFRYRTTAYFGTLSNGGGNE